MAKVDLSGFTLGSREEQVEKSQESYPAYIGRQVLGGLEKIPEGFLNINEAVRSVGQALPATAPLFRGVQTAQEAIGIPTAEEFRAGAEKKLGYEPGAFQPKGLGENIAQEAIRIGGTLGLGEAATALRGGQGALGAIKTGAEAIKSAAKPILGTAVGGKSARAVGEFLQLPEPIVDTMDVIGSFFGGIYGTRSKVAKGADKNYKKAETILKRTAKKIGENPYQEAPGLAKKIESFEDIMAKGLGYESAEEAVEKAKNLLANQNRVPIADAQNLMTEINSEYYKFPRKVRDKIINPLIGSIKDEVMYPYRKTNPSYVKAWDTARQDTFALHSRFVKTEKIAEKVEEIFEKFPLKLGDTAKKALGYLLVGSGGLGAWMNPFVTTAFGTGVAGLHQLNKFGGLVKQSKTAEKILKNTAKQLAAGNIANALKLVNKLENEIKEPENFEGFTLG